MPFLKNKIFLSIFGIGIAVMLVARGWMWWQKPPSTSLVKNCKMTVQDIAFTDSTSPDGLIRTYKGVIKNSGDVNVIYRGVNGKLFDKDDGLLSEAHYDIGEDVLITLTERIALELSFKPIKPNNNWTKNVDRYEFTPMYSCSTSGFYR